MDDRFDGRVAVITGGASGIGAAAARLFAEKGACLALVDRDAAALEGLAADLSGLTSVSIHPGDVGDAPTVTRHMADILDRHGRVDVLFACAGYSTGTAVPDTTLEMWEGVIRANLTGSFLWSQAVLAPMREAGSGSIVLVGSQLAFSGGKANAAYLASKGAIVALMQTMALDHAAEGIRVNAVIPGAIDTPLLRRAFARAPDPEAAKARSVGRHPLGRLGTPEEVARAALFLASDAASFTTGTCLRVDGGWLVG
ncbi:NAD(P)-dependent dehydrogenase, short-chain alcohol dehydrogenase family [Devosia enhydra]|uniref:NAD(P)-dependent dehydrogenase, short-chain alcohol dehydrogenase family n=1 Tax=Devosia enhydra TaxID=665118 RepID=A0A1K2HWF5_9HYPH|nr:SDR family oxidoreductase [Devosia enhydra]SFZ83363.1 NAD(P)-dependent dehydrogenase, short-chain alcohol dehydrogenase family [Devosia enhydra]